MAGSVRRGAFDVAVRLLSTGVRATAKNRSGLFRATMLSASGGAVVGVGYSVYTHYDVNKSKLAGSAAPREVVLAEKPSYVPSKRVIGAHDPDLEIVLFQYANCPFCSKTRAYLDAKGHSYELVEVDALFKRALEWSSYRKVPTALVKTADGYRQLCDSSLIVSVLESRAISDGRDVGEIAALYPSVRIVQEDGTPKDETLNKYFLMYGETPVDRSTEALTRERKWRQWADEVFVHVISPNVYRTYAEARESFRLYADVGEWRSRFSAWETTMMIEVGAAAMWAIGRRLKKKHLLKDDVRLSFYDECNAWTRAIKKNGTQYMGGSTPDLSDLAVYGILSSVEGTSAFNDVIDNTNIKRWYNDMKEFINNNKGVVQVL